MQFNSYPSAYMVKEGKENLIAPNKACTRLVGVCAFSSSFLGSKLVPAKWHCLVPPTSG